jgi:hypothetical protein
MADATPTDPKHTDPAAEPQEVEQAHPHHKDKGKVVRTAFGEPMSGGIADITDGDDE